MVTDSCEPVDRVEGREC